MPDKGKKHQATIKDRFCGAAPAQMPFLFRLRMDPHNRKTPLEGNCSFTVPSVAQEADRDRESLDRIAPLLTGAENKTAFFALNERGQLKRVQGKAYY